MIAYRLIISGSVQGVGFRQYAGDRARALNLGGYVTNLSDGTVECFVEGSENDIEEFIHWVKIGSSYADVKKVAVEKEPVRSYSHFKIV